MKKLLCAAALACAAIVGAACQTVLTAERCQQAIVGAVTVEQVAAVLVNSGLDSDRARTIAHAIMVGRIAIAAACDAARAAEEGDIGPALQLEAQAEAPPPQR